MVNRVSTWPTANRRASSPADEIGRRALARRPAQKPPEPASRTDEAPVAVPNASASGNIDNEAIGAWRTEVGKLTKEELDSFLKTSRPGNPTLDQYATAIEAAIGEKVKKSKSIKAAKWLRPLFEFVNLYAPIGTSLSQLGPSPASLIFGGVTCVLSASIRFVEYQEKLVEMLSSIVANLAVVEQYKTLFPENADLQAALITVYIDILRFCVKASRLFLDDKGKERSGGVLFLASLPRPFESKFGELLRAFKEHMVTFERHAALADSQRLASMHKMQLAAMSYQELATSELARRFTSIQEVVEEGSARKRIEEELRLLKEVEKLQDERRQRLLRLIPFISFEEVQDGKVESILDGTGHWLLSNEAFAKWRSATEPTLLWVYGKHGCGKSHLAARVIDDLKSSYDLDRPRDATATAIAYVYCSPQDLGGTSSKNPSRASGEPNRIDLANLLGSILRQIVAQLPLSVDVPLRARLESKAEAPTGREMREMIKATIALFPQVFLVVDGLDECQNLPENQFEGLCRYLRSLATTGASSACAKVIVFSRPEYPEIDKAFAGCASVQVDAGANDNDIKEFIAHRVSSLKKAPPVLEEIRGVIFERADGMFLWVHLLVKALKELRTTKKVKEAVKNIPVGLDTVYALSMERIWGQSPVVREQAMKALLWVANAMRPLSRRELLDALSTEPDTDYLDEESRIDDDSGLAAECADLIILKNDQYHLLHSSLKDYLDSLAPSSPGLEEYQILQSRGERILASTCLTYLGFKPFRIGPVSTESELKLLLESNPLLEYAACYWGEHLSRAKVDAHDELSDRARCFLRSDKARDLSLQASRLQKPSSPFINLGATSPLHALAVFKLRFIAESLEDCEAMISETDSLGFFPMDYAMITTNHEMSAWFLIKCSESGTVGSSVESFPSKLPLLHLAAENGWEDITTKLIVLGFDVDSDPDGIGTPLHCAAESGKKSAVQVLLRAGANINALNKDGRTPLLLAASNAHNEVVDILLQNGADVKITGRDKTTVLHYVARNSDAALTQKVLEMGADIDSRGGSEVPGGTPLHYSVNNDVAEVVSVLLDDGASTEARTNQGNTPLLLACSWGRPSCLRVLLQRGAQSGVQNNANESAFHLAAQDGHADILQILLNDPPALVFLDVLNKSGNTPLISAIIRGQTAACKVLLDHGARTDVVNSIARPPLHVAIEFGELEIGMTLMEQYGADVKQLGLNGETTLQCAARFGRIEWIPLLLSRSVDPEKQDVYGDRAVHRAVDNGQLAFLKELVAARPGLNLLAKNKRGNTPLHKASWLSELGVAQFLVNQFRYEHGIAENPTNCAESSERGTGMPTPGQLSRALHDTDEHGRTALHFAAASGGPVLEYLLQQGADVNTVDRFGHTALVSAIGTKKTEAAKLLLTYNVDLTLTDKQGKCALVFAIEGRLVGLVGILLDKYVDAVSIPDIRGGRALHYAACCGHPQILDSVAHVQEDVSHQVDCLGWDALCYAATFGHAQLIEPLMHLGMGPDGSPIADESPLGVAIDLGHLVFAKRLLEKKANIDSPTGPLWRQPPLHRALLRGRLHTAKVLLKAGANPTVRDVFGLSALDHASEDVEIRSALESRIPGFRPLPLVDRSRRLRSIVAACSSALKDLDLASADSRADYRRVENLICLAYTLLRLERKKDADNANLCFTELSNKAAQPTAYCATMRCRICGTCPIVDRTRYICKRCPRRVELCSKCFHAFIDPEVASSRGRDALKELRQYETDANKLRVLLEPLLHTGVERIERVISNPSLRWRLKPRLELYDAWMRKHNASGQFLPKAIPGWQLLKLLEKAHNVRKQIDAEAQDAKSKKDEGTVESKKTADGKKKETSTSEHHGEATKTTDGPSNGSPWDSINAELLELYADHRPNWDEATFNCFEHSFMEVHDGLDLLSDEAKTNFDSNGRLISAFFQRLEEEYSSEIDADLSRQDHGDVTANPDASEPGFQQAEEPITEISGASHGESGGEGKETQGRETGEANAQEPKSVGSVLDEVLGDYLVSKGNIVYEPIAAVGKLDRTADTAYWIGGVYRALSSWPLF